MLRARLLGLAPLFSAALCVATAANAHAAGPVSLRWSAPADCPTSDDVLAEVNRLLGARASSDQSPLDVVAEVQQKDDETYRVRLEIPGADGPRVREVSAVSCAALGPAAALILAMMVDPEAALAAPPAPSSPGPTPPGQTQPPQPSPGSTEAKEVRPTETPRPPPLVTTPPITPPPMTASTSGAPEKKAPVAFRRPSFSFSLQGFVDVGSLLGPGFGLGGALGVFPGRWRFEAGVLHVLEQSSEFLTLSKAERSVSLTAFQGAGGFAFMLNPDLEFIPRVRLDVGRFRAASFGVSDVGEGTGTFVGLGIGGAFSVRLTQYVRGGIGLDAIKPLAYPQFIVTGVGVAHEPWPAVFRLSLGLEGRL